ncbi:MAG: ParM/StbA family protein [Proteobacteria bacterium]|nr:ParM/StbA family protein [Pseudomonadota bacterium]
MITGIDIGYGYTKIVTFDGKYNRKFIFPSLVSKYIPERSFKESFEVIHVNGRKYIVGEDVDGSTKAGFNFTATEEYIAIVGYSLSKITAFKKVIVLGLPPQAYDDARIQHLKEVIMKMEVRTEDGTKIYMPSTIEFVPQGAGIFFSHLTTGNGASDFSKTVAVVDIGYHTMDVVLFDKEYYKAHMARSYPLGVKSLYSMVRDAYIKKYGIFLSQDNDRIVERLLKYGRISPVILPEGDHDKHTIDTEEILNEYYLGRVKKSIAEYVSDATENGYVVEKVVFGGGGISYMGGLSRDSVVVDPLFANARGFTEYGLKL